MDRWDETAADAAIAGLVRSAGADELFDLFSRYGARDFRDIGHKMIYVSNSFRCLEVIGWQHAEPVLRSLTYALLERSGAKGNPAEADLPEDRPGRDNLIAQKELPESWTGGQRKPGATTDLLALLRTGSPADASKLSVELLKNGAAPSSLFDAFFCGAGELLMRAPGIVSLHAVTFTNAAHYAWQRCRNDETRRLLILQNAAFLPLFRGTPKEHSIKIDALEPLAIAGVGEIFDDISRDRLTAARKILAHLQAGPDATAAFAQSARRLVFAKGNNSHDYKFSSAVLEDYRHLSPPWRDRLLAASAFYLRGSGDRDNALVQRTRAALAS